MRREADAVTLYALRHTAATLLLAGGIHAKAVSERMGHASAAFTVEIYVHSLPTVQEEPVAKLEELVFKGGGGSARAAGEDYSGGRAFHSSELARRAS